MHHIDTKRLRMRPFAAGDLELLVRLHGDPDVMAWMRGGVQTAAEARVELDGYLATWREHGYGIWALFHKADEAFIGECGLRLIDDDLATRLRVALAVPWRGRGLAQEAAAAAVRFGFENAGLDRLVAVTGAVNGPSRKTLKGIGMIYRPDLDRDGGEAIVYEMTREAWLGISSQAPY